MSKLLRSELKSIVKECLVEILSEGLLGDNNKSFMQESNQNLGSFNKKLKKDKANTRSYLNKISYNQDSRKKVATSNIKNTNLTSDPILNDLLADTAKTTLQEQLSAESRRGPMVTVGGDKATMIVNQSDPTELFGAESAGKWAQLAFFDQ
jgi:hypothetical protein